MNDHAIDGISAVIGFVLVIAGLVLMAVAVFVTRDWMLLALGAALLWFGEKQ